MFYVARFAEAIYVLHAFEKKTRKTARPDLEIGRTRLREVLRMRQERRRTNGEESAAFERECVPGLGVRT